MLDILLPSVSKLVNCSLSADVVRDCFKKAIFSLLIKKASVPPDEFKNYQSVSGMGFIFKPVKHVVASQ